MPGLAPPVADGGLNLPFPELLAFLAAATEVVGCICIALGLFTRIIAIPIDFYDECGQCMVHWKHGWDAIATGSMESTIRLNGFITWLAENFPGRYNYITELGDPVMLNNGMEFAAHLLRDVNGAFCLRRWSLSKPRLLLKTF